MSDNRKNFLQRILMTVSGAKAAPEVESKPVFVNETPAWVEINAVNRASIESGVHLEQMRKAQAEMLSKQLQTYS
jgi:hypothetical protein